MDTEEDAAVQQQVEQAWRSVEDEESRWATKVMAEFQYAAQEDDVDANIHRSSTSLVVIGGSGLLQSSLFSNFIVEVHDGLPTRRIGDVAFISRHTANANEEYRQPHQVDHKLIWNVIKKLKPESVLGVCSVGSLDPEKFPLGTIACATDWLHATFTPAYLHDDAKAHVKPVLDETKRRIVVDTLLADESLKGDVINPSREVVYCQTRGPRFETKAEIRMIRTFADLVGMTAGDEASMASELGIPYVMLCFVDNIAHGLSSDNDKNITNIEAFRKAQKANLDKVEQAVKLAVKSLSHGTKITKSLSAFSIDTLIRARYVHTVDASDRLISHGIVAIRDGEIVGVHDEAEGYPPYQAQEVFNFPDAMVMPGLINAHTHAAMTLMRGFGDDLKLTDWLTTKIWPAEAKCVSREYVRDGTRLAFEEMIASGTTSCLDLYFFPDVIEDVCLEIGMRGVIGQVVIEFPSPMAKDGDDYLRLVKHRLERFRKQNTSKPHLVTFAITPHAPYSVSEAHMIEAKALAKEYGCCFHTHLHECEEEIAASVALDRANGFCHRCDVACRPLANLERIGLLDSSCSFAHMTQLEDSEIDLIVQRGCHVVHCPASNMKLASGFCPVAKLLDKGVNVALGTDGAASNNSLDMVAEIKLAALIGKGVAKSPTAVNARQAIRMATINGAKAIGLEKVCGSLEVGKRADVIVVDLLNRNTCRPVYDPISSFVYSATRDSIRGVWIDGHAKLIDGVRINGREFSREKELRECAERWQRKMEDVVRELAET